LAPFLFWGQKQMVDDGKLTPKQQLLAEAKKRFTICVDTSSELRKASQTDMNFIDGNQWDSQIKQMRQEARRPSLTINKLRVYINQVMNDIRANRPQIKVRPIDDFTDTKTARVINGLIKHICNNGNYKDAIDNATKYAVSAGFGYVRITTDYLHDRSMLQEFRIKIIDNPFLVYFPINLCHELDYSDAPYAFIRMSMSKDDFKLKYPKADDQAKWEMENIGDTAWRDQEEVWLAEYFVVEDTEITLYQLEDGTVVDNNDAGLPVVKERKSKSRKVKWYLLSEHSILDEEELPFSSIPIVPILGQDFVINGKKRYYSLIRDAIDPQRLYNFWRSSEAEMIMLSPKAIFMGAKGMFEGLENQYKEANARPISFLEYNPSDSMHNQQPPPTRIEPPTISAAYIQAAAGANDDIRATTGLFAASLGEAGSEKSGKAILARQRQGDTANFHFFEAVNCATRRIGRLLIDGIPKIYDTVRTIRILGEDSTEDVVQVNQMYHDDKTGLDVLYDLTAGEYDVIVDTSVSYETKRLESMDILSRFVQSYPPAAQVIGDLLAKNLDIPEASEMAERLKRTIPPNLLSDPNEQGIDEAQVREIVQDLEKLQGQLQASETEKQALHQMLQKMQQQLESKEQAEQIKADSAIIKADAEIQKAKMGLHQEMIKQQGSMRTHTIDSAIKLHQQTSSGAFAEQPRPGTVPATDYAVDKE
jgi:hypothetical protein